MASIGGEMAGNDRDDFGVGLMEMMPDTVRDPARKKGDG